MAEELKRALSYAFERMLDESLAETLPQERVWLHIRRDVVERVAKCEEVQEYIKGIKGDKDREFWPEWYGLPRMLYGFRTFAPNSGGWRLYPAAHPTQHDVKRIVPDLYLYWYKEGVPAWFMPVPYIPE